MAGVGAQLEVLVQEGARIVSNQHRRLTNSSQAATARAMSMDRKNMRAS